MQRIIFSAKAASAHLLLSFGAAVLASLLILGVWYPAPYDTLAGGKQLLIMIIAIDVVCGPLLTFIIFNPKKSKVELWRDIGVIVVLQLAALGYGVFTAFEARPVWLAFEGDRFRIVSIPDIDFANLEKSPKEFRRLSFWGPRLLGVRLLDSDDPKYLESIQLSMEGVHPSFRPERWTSYGGQKDLVLIAIKPLEDLYKKSPEAKNLLNAELERLGAKKEQLGYLPLNSKGADDWVVLLSRSSAAPQAIIHVNPW